MRKKMITGLLCIMSTILLCACKPSDNKIIEAQSKYRELVDIHSKVVSAHQEIADDSLDEALVALSESIPKFTEYNLYDMTNSQIDELIASMDVVITSYAEYLVAIGDIKSAEDSSVLIPVYFNLANGTNMTFVKLTLEEEGESDSVSNALETSDGLKPGQEIVGLAIHKDSQNTPWILTLSTSNQDASEASDEDKEADNDTDEASEAGSAKSEYQLEIDVTKLSELNNVLTVLRDEETGELYFE